MTYPDSDVAGELDGTLDTLVAFQRGFTDAEADVFLSTGKLPDLSRSLAAPEPVEDLGYTEDEARALLAGIPILAAGGPGAPFEVTLKFDPNQRRDEHGRWTETGSPGVSTPGDVESLTREELVARSKRVKQVVGAARKKLSTQKTHTIAYDVWSPERDAQHRQIVDEVYARYANVPNEGRAIIVGGPSGAGKTSTLRDSVGIGRDDYVTIDPDDMKYELARRGLVPDVPGGEDLSPMERSTLVHVESMRLARMLAQRAYRDRKNVIWDITMTDYDATNSHVKALRGHGYDRVDAVYVHVSPETSRRRVHERYAAGVNAYRRGEGEGGRYIPSAVLQDQYDQSGQPWARRTFEGLRDDFDGWVEYDNDVEGRAPQRRDGEGVISGD